MRLPWRRGYVEAAAWLADDVLLAVGWLLAPADTLRGFVRQGSRTLPVELLALDISRPDLLDSPFPVGKVLVIRLPEASSGRVLPGRLVIDAPGGRCTTSPAALSRVLTDVRSLARTRLGWLSRSGRDDVTAFLARALDSESGTRFQLAGSLRELRATLWEFRQPSPVDRLQVTLEHVFRIDDQAFYVSGWTEDSDSSLTRLTTIAPEGQRTEILRTAFRHPLPDENGRRVGFCAFVPLNHPSLSEKGWSIEIATADGAIAEADGPPVVSDSSLARRGIVRDVRFDDRSRFELIRTQIFPALDRLQQRHALGPPAHDIVEFGVAPAAPDVSIVVPVYERLDLLEPQLADFADDPELRDVDLLYVLDSPELAAEFLGKARELHAVYELPFRVLLLQRHLGFSLAVNAGIASGRGRLALMLNSDVFPVESGWVGRMARFHDRTPNIGALGVKLIYDDGTLQHAGMYFDRPRDSPIWRNRHYFKGFDRSLPPANVARRVPAVTGACLMMSRNLFMDQGGLRACYVDGDYEDSDLCLRLMTAGRDNWYFPEVELYHLEGQSYPWGSDRVLRALYNGWLHHHLWNDTIASVMREQREADACQPAASRAHLAVSETES